MPKRRNPSRVRNQELVLFKNVDQVFPPRMPVVLRYCQQNLLTAAGAYTGNTFRLNSCFDPDQTGTGAQPNYYDTFAALYQKYRVVKCRYNIKLTSRAGSGGLMAIGISTATTHNTIGSAEAAAGLPLAKSVAFGGTGSSPAVLRGVIKIGDPYGLTETQIMSDPNFNAVVGASIGNSVYMAICIDTYGSTDTVGVETTLEFYTVFESRAYQAQS